MVLANKAIMGKTEMKKSIHILAAILLLLSPYGCNNNRLSRKEYNQILDSLKRIKVPLTIDTCEVLRRQRQDIEDFRIPDSNGILREEYQMLDNTFQRRIRHKDSLFEMVYEYRPNGLLERYYRKYFNSLGYDPVGDVIFYNEQGEVESFRDRIWLDEETANNAKYTIYDLINKLQSDSIDLLKHNVYIAYTDWTGKRGVDYRNKEYYWIVIINYYYNYDDVDKKLSHQRKLRINPNTGEVLEDWTDQWE